MPMVSIIMSTYNTPNDWLYEAINSILTQSYEDFEFIIVDDCSTTAVSEVREKCIDKRIIWLQNDSNLGLTKSLNKAMKIAKGKYIARMDADDISLPNRLNEQVKFMEDHPNIIVCGSWRRAFGTEEKDEIWDIPLKREEQQVQLFFYNCGLTHPTAMFRASMLKKFNITYNEAYKKAQDYGIWVQCTRFAPMAMMHKVLLLYRKSEQQITANKKSVKSYASQIKIDQLKALGIKATEDEEKLHICFCNLDTNASPEKLHTWVNRLLDGNENTKYFEHRIFQKEIKRHWYEWCRKAYVSNRDINAKRYYLEARTVKNVVEDITLQIKQQIKAYLDKLKEHSHN